MKNWTLLLLLAVAGYWLYQNHAKKEALRLSSEVGGTVHAVALDSQTFHPTLRAGKPVLVDFCATWCGPSRMLAPTIEQLANENQDRLVVAKVDVDLNPDLSLRYAIQTVPTLILFRDGQEVERLVGFPSRERIEAALSEELAPRS